MLGECIGVAFHPREGMCHVFQSLDSTRYVVLVAKSGTHYVMRRELVAWRRAQGAGSMPVGESAPPHPTLFEIEEP